MLRVPKAKNARTKRALEKRAPKVIENPKKALFVRGNTAGIVMTEFLKDMAHLKKPDSVSFRRRNAILPFEDATSLEFYSDKNDTSLFMFGNHTKKRPNNITMGRMFNNQLLDMVEFGLNDYDPMASFENVTPPALGSKPAFIFNGELFDRNIEYGLVKSVILDFYKGREVDRVCLQGLETVISVTAAEDNKLYFRTFKVALKKSGTRTPRVELENLGPHFDMQLRRTKFAARDTMKAAMKKPRVLTATKTKNITRDSLGDQYARVHMERQDMDQLQLRKVKALKKDKANSNDFSPEQDDE